MLQTWLSPVSLVTQLASVIVMTGQASNPANHLDKAENVDALLNAKTIETGIVKPMVRFQSFSFETSQNSTKSG